MRETEKVERMSIGSRATRMVGKVLCGLLLLVVIGVPVLAAVTYTTALQLVESGGVTYGQQGWSASYNNSYAASQGYITASGLDTQVLENSVAIPWMLATDRTLFSTSLAASSTKNLQYTFGNTLASYFSIIPGYGGYITTADAAALELSNAGAAANFTIDLKGYVDTTAGSNKNLIYKSGAASVYVSNTSEITATIGVEQQPIVGGFNDALSSAATEYNGLMGGGAWNATENIVYQCIPTGGTISNLYIKLSANVAAGATYTFTLMVNSAPSALAVTISAGASTGSNLVNSVNVVAGQTVSLRSTYTGAPGNPTASWSSGWVPTIPGESILLAHIPSHPAQAQSGEVQGSAPGGIIDAVEVSVQAPIPTAGTFKKLYVRLSVDPGDPAGPDGYSFTLRLNAGDTALTTSIFADNTTGNNAVGTVAVVAGGLVNIRINPLNAPEVGPRCAIGMVFVSSTSGESIVMGGSSNDTPTINATEYLNFCGTGLATWTAAEASMYSLTQAGNLKNLYVSLSAAPGGATSYTVSIRGAGDNTGLTVTITGAAKTGNDTAHTYSSLAGDTVDARVVTTAGAAASYVHWGVVYFTSNQVTATGATSGVRRVVVQATGGGTNLFTINVYDDAGAPVGVAGSVSLQGFIVSNNNNSWLINQNNVMPYITYLKITTAVGGSSEKLWYQPSSIITSSLLPNIDSGGSYPGTFTWGSNPAGVSATMGAMTPSSTAVAAPPTTIEIPSIGGPTPGTGVGGAGTEGSGFFLYEWFKALVDQFNQADPSQQMTMGWFWMVVAGAINLVVLALAAIYLKSMMLVGIAGFTLLAIECSYQVYDWSVLILYIILVATFWVFQRVQSVGG